MMWLFNILVILIIVWFSFRIYPKIREILRPRPEALKDLCPHCNEEVEENRRYCMACGGQIWTNVLSDDKKNK